MIENRLVSELHGLPYNSFTTKEITNCDNTLRRPLIAKWSKSGSGDGNQRVAFSFVAKFNVDAMPSPTFQIPRGDYLATTAARQKQSDMATKTLLAKSLASRRRPTCNQPFVDISRQP